jgi:hypothetical protein
MVKGEWYGIARPLSIHGPRASSAPTLYDGPVSIAVDSSGVRVYGGRKRYIKIHFAVEIVSK